MTEPTMNQYAPPRAQVEDMQTTTEVGELKMFSPQGRIGRLRYLAYGAGAGILYNIAISALTIGLAGSNALFVAIIALFAVMLWFSVITGIKRCHDMDISGWWSLTLIIPIIVFAWIFWPGSRGANRFGAPPPPNTLGVKLLAWIMPVIMIIGILAAIAIPQYKNYSDRVRASQSAPPAK